MSIKNIILNNGLTTAAMISLLLIADCQQANAQSDMAKSNPSKVNMPVLNTVSTDTATVDSLVVNNFASLGDFVWIDNNANGIQDKGEPGISNIEVILYDSLLNIIDSKYTDDSGYYHFNKISIEAGSSRTFIVGFSNIPPNYAYTNLITDSIMQYVSNKSDTISGRTKPFVLHAGENRTDIDGGIKNAPGVVLPLIINQFNGNYSDGFIHLGWSTY